MFLDVKVISDFRFVLEGVIGDGILGDIAIDDISYRENITCGSTTNPPFETTTTPYPATNLDCDFECNCSCSWNSDPTSNMEWIVKRGASEVLFTGPNADHTLQSSSGYYAYIKTLPPVVFNDSARIVSPSVNTGSNGLCFKFFYHMFGTNVNKLNIYAKRGDNLGKPIWQKQGEQGNRWFLGQVYLEKSNDALQFVIEGVAGNGVR